MEGGGFAAARPSIVRKESGGALAWNQGHLPFKVSHLLGFQTFDLCWPQMTIDLHEKKFGSIYTPWAI